MCGIIGIISKKNQVSLDIYNALLIQQHRGQDAAGILTLNKNEVLLKKEGGLVYEVFKQHDLEKLAGNLGIGHVRYPTTEKKKDAQPFYNNFSGIGLVHNGHIINERQLREKLEEKKIYCDSDCDAETLLNVFSYFFLQEKGHAKERCFKSLEKLMSSVLGAYSVVSVIQGAGLLAFRDPYGIRPLVYGKRDFAHAFASETIALEQLDFTDIRNLEPGEAVFVDKNLNLESRIIAQKGHRHCMFEWVYFSRATSNLERIKINSVRARLGAELARLYKEGKTSKRLEQKGFEKMIIVSPVPETARPAAIVFSEKSGYKYKDALEKNRYAGRLFIKPNQEVREKETLMGIVPIREIVKGKIVFIVDDSIVRGTTSKRMIQTLRKYGASEVHLFITCPPLKYPCDYGIDFHQATELIAHDKSIAEIATAIGADSLTYMSIAGLANAIGLPKEQLCLACLNNEYPTKRKHPKMTLNKIFGY